MRIVTRLAGVALVWGLPAEVGGNYNEESPWKLLNEAAWPARGAFAAVSLDDGAVLAMGGSDENSQMLRDVWRSVPTTSATSDAQMGATWELMTAEAAWSGRELFSAVALPNRRAMILGGRYWLGRNAVLLNDVWVSTQGSDGASWVQQAEQAEWAARHGMGAVSFADGSVMLTGGSSYATTFGDVWKSNDDGASWQLQTDSPAWGQRANHAVVAIPSSGSTVAVLLLGGEKSLGDYRNDVWISDATGASWSLQLESAPWSSRDVTAVALSDGSVVLIGGQAYTPTFTLELYGDVWRSPPGSMGATWQLQTAATGWSARSTRAVALTAGRSAGQIMLMGGTVDGEQVQSDIWRTEIPCQFSALLNGTVGDCAAVLPRQECQPECNTGYTASTPTATCSDGLLSLPTCDANPCTDLVEPLNGTLVGPGHCPATLLSGSTCSVSCDMGFRASGQVSCHAGQVTLPTCEPLSCSLDIAITNGHFGNCKDELQHEGECQIGCDEGYAASMNLSCEFGQIKSAECLPLPCRVEESGNGALGDCLSTLASGETCQPSCIIGYELNTTLSCSLGVLQGGNCLPKPCVDVPAPESGGMGDCPNTLRSGASCQPSCDEGYSASATTCYLGNVTVEECLPEPCNIANAPPNANDGNCSTSLPSGMVCQPSCNEGYSRVGETSCQAGVLTEARCEESNCTAIGDPEHGSSEDCEDTLSSRGSCQPTCDAGYEVSGATTCRLGVVAPALCEPKSCAVEIPTDAASGNCPQVLTSGSSCQPSCKDGYTLQGKISCWLGSSLLALCSPSSCTVGSILNGGSGNCTNLLESGSQCQPACDDDFLVSGITSCAYGLLTPATCLPTQCTNVEPPVNGSLGDCPDVLAWGASCQPLCDEGFVAMENKTTTCARGQLAVAECTPLTCKVSNAPDNGGIGNCSATLLSGDSCVPDCNQGYEPNGQTVCLLGNLSEATCVSSIFLATRRPTSTTSTSTTTTARAPPDTKVEEQVATSTTMATTVVTKIVEMPFEINVTNASRFEMGLFKLSLAEMLNMTEEDINVSDVHFKIHVAYELEAGTELALEDVKAAITAAQNVSENNVSVTLSSARRLQGENLASRRLANVRVDATITTPDLVRSQTVAIAAANCSQMSAKLSDTIGASIPECSVVVAPFMSVKLQATWQTSATSELTVDVGLLAASLATKTGTSVVLEVIETESGIDSSPSATDDSKLSKQELKTLTFVIVAIFCVAFLVRFMIWLFSYLYVCSLAQGQA